MSKCFLAPQFNSFHVLTKILFSLDNLYVDDEFHTMDELLHVVPERASRQLKPLKTLEALPKDLSEKDIEKNSLGIRSRFRRPLVDMSYLNSPDGPLDCGLPIQDVVFTVFVYRPIALNTVDCSNAVRFCRALLFIT